MPSTEVDRHSCAGRNPLRKERGSDPNERDPSLRWDDNTKDPRAGGDDALLAICEKPLKGERITESELLILLQATDLSTLGDYANRVRWMKHPDPTATYNIDRNINYTNICVATCSFCAFKRKAGESDAYVLTQEVIDKKIEELMAVGGRQILLQGGMNVELPLEYYTTMLSHIKKKYGIHIHAFSAPEIHVIARLSKLSYEDTLSRLREAGLDSLPGGGAEILSPKNRTEIGHGKCTADQWISVHRAAHSIGMRSTATMMYGHIESLEERVEHFKRIRDLQDETLRVHSGQASGFTAFISWTFQPDHTELGPRAKIVGSFEYLKVQAISRLYLDNIDNIQSSWVTQGPKIGQIALLYGANDLGSTMLEENVVSAAGTTYSLAEADLIKMAEEAGLTPQRRNFFYDVA